MKSHGDRYSGLIALAAAASLWLAPVSAGQQAGQTTPPQTPQTPARTATAPKMVKAGDIAANPEKHYGQKVIVSSEVDTVLGAQTFTLDEDKAFAGPDVLVIAPALSAPVPDGETVTVTGTLKKFVEVEIKRDYDWNWWADWKEEMKVQFKDRPVILADSIRTKAGVELVKKTNQ
jgi:hypothetical protein